MGLFTPKWLKDSSETRKLTDQEKLKKAVRQGETPEVRIAALDRITDLEFLYDTLSSLPPRDLNYEQQMMVMICLDGLSGKSRSLIIKAATQLKGRIRTLAQNRLLESEAYSLLPECSDEIACELLMQIKDPEKIIEISKQTDRPVLAKAAIDKMVMEGANLIRHKNALEEVRRMSERERQQWRYRYYNQSGFKGLSDKDLLDIADNAEDDVIRSNAIYHIVDPAVIVNVITSPGRPEDVLIAAVRKVKDPELLRRVIENEQYPDQVRKTALEKAGLPEEYCLNIIWNGDNTALRREAIWQITNRDELIKIRDEIGELKLKQCACGIIGHEYGSTYIEKEPSRWGRGYREHVMQKCLVCGIEMEVDAYDYED